MGNSQSDLSARVLIASSLAWVVAMAWNQAISGFLHHWIEERVDRELKAQGALSGYEQLPLLVYACIITLVVAAFATLWPVGRRLYGDLSARREQLREHMPTGRAYGRGGCGCGGCAAVRWLRSRMGKGPVTAQRPGWAAQPYGKDPVKSLLEMRTQNEMYTVAQLRRDLSESARRPPDLKLGSGKWGESGWFFLYSCVLAFEGDMADMHAFMRALGPVLPCP